MNGKEAPDLNVPGPGRGEVKGRGQQVAYVATRIGDYANHGKGKGQGKKAPYSTNPRLFTYQSWRLLGEYDRHGNPVQETVWLGNLPIATMKDGVVYYIHTDHLGTPRVITDERNREVWRWDSDPFGNTPANEDPDGDGNTFTYNLRFPGQYFDVETGLHYNYFRTYDPSIGRYIESDPVGLKGGLNTYLYANANPIPFVDPLGKVAYVGDPKEILLCTYYAGKCQQTGGNCPYYCNLAPAMCTLGEYSPIMVGVDEQNVNCIRRCLIREDQKAWNDPDNLTSKCDGCVKDDVINQYHIKCFAECGVNPVRYPGIPPGSGNGN